MSWNRVAVALVVTLLAAPALAQQAQTTGGGSSGWGLRVGVADDPDQIVAGAEFDFGEFTDNLHFRPNLELGIGDDVVLVEATGAVFYHFGPVDKVRPYAGGGVVVGFVDVDSSGPGNVDDGIEIAFEAAGGVGWPLSGQREFFVELDLLFGDLQDVKLVAGWRF